jgi:hypothetical protein
MTTQVQLRQAEDARCAALLAGDIAALDKLLSEKLTFTHASGSVDDKRALLEKMAAGGIVYHAIKWSAPQFDVRGELAAMQGVMTLEVTVNGIAKTLKNSAILLWEQADGGWKLLYFQSTPIQAT